MYYQLDKLYETNPISYSCTIESREVSLVALWHLDTEQGAEGQIFPVSSKCVCSAAKNCGALASDNCPLTVGYGDALNKLKIIVLDNVKPLQLKNNKGELLGYTGSRMVSTGFPIWFGKTSILKEVPGSAS